MESINSQYLWPAKFQKAISEEISQCLTCERRCKIAKNQLGYCQTRLNKKSVINTLVYGLISSLSFNPIEKKPLYHFYPGSIAITIGTYGCNFNCFWCQNHLISHPEELLRIITKDSNDFISPEKIVELALDNNCQGTSISFNEPTLLFEYALKLFELAKKEGLYNTFVSNGYMTEEVLNNLASMGLDAINIDIKGDKEMVKKYCGGNVDLVWRNAKIAKELGVHVEITTLLIENYNTNPIIIKEIAERISQDLGNETPLHITQFFPQYKSHEYNLFKPTPKRSLHEAYKIAKKVGLDYVYIGNLPESEYENTTCPNCSKLVIKRAGYSINKVNLSLKGKCLNCGHTILKNS